MWRMVQHPARLLPLAFLFAIVVGTLLLLLPAARSGPESANPVVTALFTATSAICVTGLIVVDTTYWSGFGHGVIAGLLHVGGYGIMTAATLLALLVSNRLGLRTRMLATTEGRSMGLANVRGVLLRVALIQLACEVVVAAVLTLRWWLSYGQPLPEALWNGVFHGISAFSNGGFSLFSDSFEGYLGDWWIGTPIVFGVIAGGLGFPVMFELGREWGRPRLWSVHTRITVFGSALLFGVGIVVLLAFEWSNPATFGPLSVADKTFAAFFDGVMPRSGGFNTTDFSAMFSETISVTNALMFIGGGSASTAGGIKVTTFFLLAFVIWSQIRGEPDVVVARRRIASSTQREAMSVALLSVALVAGGILLVDALVAGFPFEHISFDVISAFATVGLSTGVTAAGPPAAQLVIAALMFIGRVGPVVLATGLALNNQHRHYRYPEERPIVG